MKGSASIVQINVATDSLVYLQALLNGGLLVGSHKKQSVNPKVKPLVKALYHVLAGGRVQVGIVKAGDPRQIAAYERAETLGLDSSNAINERAVHPIIACI